MASPNVFLSQSPSGSARQKSHFFTSSSPDLPPVKDILGRVSNSPPFRISHRAPSAATATANNPKTVDANPRFYSNERPHPNQPAKHPTDTVEANDDSSICIIEVPTKPPPKSRNLKHAKTDPPKCSDAPVYATPDEDVDASSLKDQPWKKYMSKSKDSLETGKAEEGETTGDMVPTEQGTSDHLGRFSAGTTSKTPEKPKISTKDANEPLYLEIAPTRRLDWTPPNQKFAIVLDSDCSSTHDLHSPAGLDEAAKSFDQFLDAYKCTESVRQDVSATSDDDSSILKKRKLIELVASKAPVLTETEAKEKSPMKQKAPKKKARTITELATAAYRTSNPTDSAPGDGSLSVGDSEKTNGSSEKRVAGGEGKAKPKRRTARASKKKKPTPPPKPILLPPTEALQEVGKQNFVFGTSSQLAIENSPTFLRDLQAAMKHSNQLDYVDLDSPLNSDAIEPLEEKQRLWDAGARDVDGNVFNFELRRIAETAQPLLPVVALEDDPFGYVRTTNMAADSDPHPKPDSRSLSADDPSTNTSERISPARELITIIDDSFAFSSSDISIGSPVNKHIMTTIGRDPKASVTDNSQFPSLDSPYVLEQTGGQVSLPKPTYELYTDTQLSKEIATYGFKAVKSRKAKIALLEQCWQSKAQANHHSLRTLATSSKPATTPDAKRPRGRPRKDSVRAESAQEPPPSAQPRMSPKIVCKQPAKKALVKSGDSKSISKKKKTTSMKTAKASASSTRKGKSTKTVVEIPDSASDDGSTLSSTPHSSPEAMFSSPPSVDVSFSVNDESDPTLTMDSTADQSLAFEYITKAVKSTPRTTDPENPSWHEKILLYDPIVLEDLAAWLNCGQLTRVGFDGEVTPSDVKKWCESKSICCLWKVSLRGRERKRF